MKTLKIIIYSAAALTALFLTGCKKSVPPLSDHPFEVEIKNIQANIAWADVIPENNDFHYAVTFVTENEYRILYKSDEAVVEANHEYLYDIYKEYFSEKQLADFMDLYLYSGAWDCSLDPLLPDTDYYAFVYPYRDDFTPMTDKVVKAEFSTPGIEPSDIKFKVTMAGSVITVTPSNSDYYFYEYWNQEEVDYYKGDTETMFRETVGFLQEYGFMEEQKQKGPVSSDIMDWYEGVEVGDKFYLSVSGYNGGINSAVYSFVLTYKGENIPGDVTILNEKTVTLPTVWKNTSIPSKTRQATLSNF